MKVIDHIRENAMGDVVNYRHYQPEKPSGNYLIFCHGSGECGLADGSQLGRVAKWGYPKYAQAGVEFPFNIICPQVVSSYSLLRKFFPAFIKLKYNAEVIIVTGLSLGGFATFDMRLWDDLNVISAIAPICGGLAASNAADFPITPAWVAHGEKDTTVRYQRSLDFVQAYNEIHPSQRMEYTLYPGVGHDAWIPAYDLEGSLLKWINTQFERNKPKDKFNIAKDFINGL